MKRGVWIGVYVLIGALFMLWAVQFFGSSVMFGPALVGGEEDCVSGSLEIIIDDIGVEYVLHADGKEYLLIVEGEVEKITAGLISDMDVTACGVAGRESITLRDLRIEGGKRSPPIGDVTGEQKIAFMLVNFQDDTSEPYTVAEMQALMEEVNQYYQEISYGQTWLNTDVFGYYTLQMSSGSCYPDGWQDRVLQNWGISPEPYPSDIYNWQMYDRVIIALNKDICSWTGRANVGKRWETVAPGGSTAWISTVWLDGPPADGRSGIPGATITTISHELGHNHGVRHAGDYECGSDVYGDGFPYSCYSVEYGDAYSVMGRSYEATSLHMDVVHKEMIGWLDEYDVEDIDKKNLGYHSIGPVQSNGPHRKTIKIPRVNRFGEPDGSYYLEYRRPIGIDAGVDPALFEGIFVRVDEWASGSGGGADVHLLDMSPHEDSEVNQVTDSNDPILQVGESYKTFNDEYVIYPLQLNDGFATVLVSRDPCYDTDSSVQFPGGKNYYEGGRLFDGMKVGKDRCTPIITASRREKFDRFEIPMSPEYPRDYEERPELQSQLIENYLEEYYCENGVWHREYKDCDDLGPEYECINAACAVPGVCTDTDGGINYYEYGEMSHEGKIGRDFCYSNGDLGEYYCDGNIGGFEIKDCTDLGSEFYCSNGGCTDCIDTDGGMVFEDRGTVTSDGVDYTDYCVGAYDLLEYYCDGVNVGNTTYDCGDFGIGYSCSLGQCVSGEE